MNKLSDQVIRSVPSQIRTITVLGAGGTMGTAIAGLFAAYGNAHVFITGRNAERTRTAVSRAARSVRGDSIRSRLTPVAWEELESAVAASDLVFESVAEDPAVKASVLARAAAALRPDALLCTGSSGLSVSALAEALPDGVRSRFFGMHLFNPPGKMTLCELIASPYTDAALLDAVRLWLEGPLGRHVVCTKDRPAFLANRIGLAFLHKAAWMADECRDRGGIDYVDALFGGFSGRAMPPLATIDFIGLDVHAAIIRNLWNNTNDCLHDLYRLPPYLDDLIVCGALGRKSGGGLFRRSTDPDGREVREVYDIVSGQYRCAGHYAFPFAAGMCVCLHEGDYAGAFRILLQDNSEEACRCRTMLGQYILYAAVAAEDTGCSLHDADVAMAAGFNWCPPLALLDALRTAGNPFELCGSLCRGEPERAAFARLQKVQPAPDARNGRLSAFDYRPFFRAKEV